jgi:hypothetical protein
LANIYLHPLDELMAACGYRMVRYADDFVVLCKSREEAEAALVRIRAWVKDNGLRLHPDKTHIGDCRNRGEGFEFLGYRFEAGGRFVRKKSLDRLKDSIRAKTRRTCGQSLARIIESLNRTLRGWFNYFKQAHPNTFPAVDQFIQRVQVDVRQQRADYGALRRALGRFPPFHSPHNFLTEPAAQQALNAPITDALLDPLHQPLMRDRVEVALKVGVDHKRVAFLDELIHFAQRIPAAAPRSKPVTHRPERRLEDRFKHKLHCSLDDTILDRGNPQRPRPAIALRYLYPPHRLRSVTALPQCRRKLF